ncbi:MAG: DUF1841 family protein [Gammaproteobacteria bacterium]|nr:DUF1841 family protein [Gammaproteobacteria bacterium]
MFGNDRDQLRRFFFSVWNKTRSHQALEPLEQQISSVLQQHPEYHRLLEQDPDTEAGRDYLPEHGQTNPYLHLGLHIALQEQLATHRPAAIAGLYQDLLALSGGDSHATEHWMMECLAEMLWQAQRHGLPPDQHAYLDCLNKLTGR